jgi:hypothetical protein
MCGLNNNQCPLKYVSEETVYVSMLVKRVGKSKYVSLEAEYINFKGGL